MLRRPNWRALLHPAARRPVQSTKSESPPVWFQVVAIIILILFTGGLWLTSVWQWRAIKEQGRLIARSEQARVYLSKLTFSRFGGDIYNRTNIPIITVGFKNYGRTVAMVTEAWVAIKIIGEPPDRPDYSETDRIFIPAGRAIAPNDEYILPERWFHDFRPEETGPTPLLPFKANFWVYGFIAYRDHLGEQHRTGFLGVWPPPNPGQIEPRPEEFIWSTKKNYTYNT
jgi:hypothetical protein